MMKAKHISFTVIVAVFLMYGCRSARVQEASEDFDKFYERFLTDSAFQMSRIQFPLPGINTTAMEHEEDSVYYWTKDDWIMLKKPELDSGLYERKMVVTDTLATDEIFMDDAGFYFKMVYEPIKEKWHLVYMVDSDM